jgi:hypothetical protein
VPHGLRAAAAVRPPPPEIYKVKLNGEEFGLGKKTLVVPTPLERKPFMSAAAGLAHKHVGALSAEQAAHRFVKMLFAHDRIDVESGKQRLAATRETSSHDLKTSHSRLKKTHTLVKTVEGLKLKRRLFHCGCCGES